MRKGRIIEVVIVLIFVVSSVYVVYTLAKASNAEENKPLIDSSEQGNVPGLPVTQMQPKPQIKAEVEVLKEPKIAPLPQSSQAYTTIQIRELTEKQGVVFCQTLEDEKDITPCIEYYWLTRAEREENPELCEKATYPGFVRQCKLQAATVAVATAYYEGFKTSGNEDFVPSNIGLCDLLDYEEDIEACKNPKEAIEKNKYELQYKLE